MHFYHICQTSSFESEPTITPANYEYYVDQGNLLLTVAYPQDTVSRDNPGIDCGPFTLITDYDSSVLDSVISATTLFTANDATSINFSTTQSDLSDTITYSVQVTQSEYDFTSLAGYVSIIVRNCETIVDDWA